MVKVEFEVETMDKAGNFVGYAFIDGKNLSQLLIEQGLAKVRAGRVWALAVQAGCGAQVHSTAERSQWCTALKAAEERARAAGLKIWTLAENQRQQQATPDDDEGGDALDHFPALDAAAAAPTAPARAPDFKTVYVTQVLPDLRLYVQFVDQGTCSRYLHTHTYVLHFPRSYKQT